MRVIFEEIYNELFFDIILDEDDQTRIKNPTGISKEFASPLGDFKSIDICVRKEEKDPKIKRRKNGLPQ